MVNEAQGRIFFSCLGLKFCSEQVLRLQVAVILAYLCGFAL